MKATRPGHYSSLTVPPLLCTYKLYPSWRVKLESPLGALQICRITYQPYLGILANLGAQASTLFVRASERREFI